MSWEDWHRKPPARVPGPGQLDWNALLPPGPARDQVAWERRQALLRAHEAGATFAQLAGALSLSYTRVRGMLAHARRDQSVPLRVFCNQNTELRQLAELLGLCEPIISNSTPFADIRDETLAAELRRRGWTCNN